MFLPKRRTSLGTDESPPNVGIKARVEILPLGLQRRFLVRPPRVTHDPPDGTEVVVHLLDDLVHGLLVRGVRLVGLRANVVVFGDLVGYLGSVGGRVVDDGLWGSTGASGCCSSFRPTRRHLRDLRREHRPERPARRWLVRYLGYHR